jgi:predicted  nucleic acid-binding Zn-ribbon protein
MHPEIETLRRLQAHEREVAAVRARLAAVPARRAEIDATIEAARRRLEAAQAEVDDRQARRRKGDSEVAALQTRLTKYRAQLMTVTTGREYEAMQHEIDSVDGQLKALEDEVIGWLMEIDELQPQVAAAQDALAEATEAARLAVAQFADEEQKDRLELAAAEGHVEAERAALSGETLAMYDRASKRYPLGAVAELKGELCAACNVRLRPMVVSDIRRGERLVLCDSCTRIMAYTPAPPATPAAEGASDTGTRGTQ